MCTMLHDDGKRFRDSLVTAENGAQGLALAFVRRRSKAVTQRPQAPAQSVQTPPQPTNGTGNIQQSCAGTNDADARLRKNEDVQKAAAMHLLRRPQQLDASSHLQ